MPLTLINEAEITQHDNPVSAILALNRNSTSPKLFQQRFTGLISIPSLFINAKNFLLLFIPAHKKRDRNLGRQPPAYGINIHETETEFQQGLTFISPASLLKKDRMIQYLIT